MPRYRQDALLSDLIRGFEMTYTQYHYQPPVIFKDKDNTMNIIYVVVAVSVGCLILWFALYRKKDTEKAVTYVCTQCGERDCNCSRVDEVKPSDEG